MSASNTKQRIKEYLELEANDNPETRLITIEDIKQVGYFHDFEVWQARLVFSDGEQWVWVIPQPVLNYYLHRGRRSDEESELATPEDAVLYHLGFLTTLRAEIRQGRLDTFEPEPGRSTQETGGEIIRVGKNVKVTVLTQRLVKEFLARGWVELETMGAGAVNQTVKAVARARQTLAAEGYALVVVPKLVQVRSGHGQETVVHLIITDASGANLENQAVTNTGF
jgi:stage V sporulation protein S